MVFTVTSSNCKVKIAPYCSLRNEAKRNEMKICSLRNENLQFAKWQSVVCEMTICSLRNDNLLSRCVYSDILNRKFPPKSRLPRKFRLRGMRDVFVASELRHFWATDSNCKQLLFPFYMPWRHHIYIDKCHYSYRDDLPENLPKNHCPSPLPEVFETPYLNQKRHAIFKRTDKIHHFGFVVYFRTCWL